MKILEAESAPLTNYEVFRHLTDLKARYVASDRRGPPNLETVVRELLQYFNTKPNPLEQGPSPSLYSPECIIELLTRLRPYDLAKGELIMLFNMRPETVAQLNGMIEEMSARFTVEQQMAIVGSVTDVLGKHPVAPQTNGGGGANGG